MPRIEPSLIPVVSDLDRGLRELGVPFGIVGALVPELLLDARPGLMTKDADVTVVVQSLADFESLKDRLASYGFATTKVPHRMHHREGGWLDILPFSEAIAPGGRLEFEGGVVLNMAGFSQVVPNTVSVSIENGPTLPLAPLPLYVLLKLVAFSDRRAAKDLGSIFHCLVHYLEDDDRRYGVEHDGASVPYEYTCAYLLGEDGRRFLDRPLGIAARGVLVRFDHVDADLVEIVARARGRLVIEDHQRIEIFELFRWYRLGLGV